MVGPIVCSRVDGEASSLYADGTGRDDADEDDRRAAGSPPSTDKHQDCDRPTCRALLTTNENDETPGLAEGTNWD